MCGFACRGAAPLLPSPGMGWAGCGCSGMDALWKGCVGCGAALPPLAWQGLVPRPVGMAFAGASQSASQCNLPTDLGFFLLAAAVSPVWLPGGTFSEC